MCKTILLIAVFGLQQLIEASVLKNFGDTHNELPHAYEKSKDELIRNKLNLRSFKNTPFLYFNVRTEGMVLKMISSTFEPFRVIQKCFSQMNSPEPDAKNDRRTTTPAPSLN